MAFNYDTTDTGYFYRLGRLVSAIYTRDDYYSAIRGELEAIAEPWENADLTDQILDVYPAYEKEMQLVTDLRQFLGDKCDAIGDTFDILADLGLTSYTPEAFFNALFLRMDDDNETIKRNTMTLGTPTNAAAAIGTGKAIVTSRLDGYNPPVINGPVIAGYATRGPTYSELGGIETFTFTCIRDRYNGATAGAEVFEWKGFPTGDKWGEDIYQGSGDGPSLTTIGEDNYPRNGDFEDFSVTANLPDEWTATVGTVGTHIAQDTVTFYRGSSAVKFIGDGAQASITLTYPIAQTDLDPLRAYLLSIRVKCSTNAPAAGTFQAYLSGTGYTPDSTESISLGHASFTTSWQTLTAPVVIPATIPTDFALVLRVIGTLTNAVSLYLDECHLSPLGYHGGFAAQILPGQTDWIVGDKITVTVNTAKTGRFQHFMRRQYGLQLPSAATPTIDGTALAAE